MHAIQANRMQSLRAAEGFLDANDARLGELNATGIRRQFDALLADVHDCAREQHASTLMAAGETARYQQLRQNLHAIMVKIVAIAAMERDNIPALSALSLPRGNPMPAKLAAHAQGMAHVVRAHLHVLSAWDRRSDLAAQLIAASDAVLESYARRALLIARRRAATVGLARKLARGRLLLDCLTALIRSQTQHDVAILAAWRSVIAVRKVAYRKREKPQPVNVLAEVHALVDVSAPAVAPPMKLLTSGAATPLVALPRAHAVIDFVAALSERKAG